MPLVVVLHPVALNPMSHRRPVLERLAAAERYHVLARDLLETRAGGTEVGTPADGAIASTRIPARYAAAK